MVGRVSSDCTLLRHSCTINCRCCSTVSGALGTSSSSEAFTSLESFISAVALLGQLEDIPMTDPKQAACLGGQKCEFPWLWLWGLWPQPAYIIRPWWILCKVCRRPAFSTVPSLPDPFCCFSSSCDYSSPVSIWLHNLLHGEISDNNSSPYTLPMSGRGQILVLSSYRRAGESAQEDIQLHRRSKGYQGTKYLSSLPWWQ